MSHDFKAYKGSPMLPSGCKASNVFLQGSFPKECWSGTRKSVLSTISSGPLMNAQRIWSTKGASVSSPSLFKCLVFYQSFSWLQPTISSLPLFTFVYKP